MRALLDAEACSAAPYRLNTTNRPGVAWAEYAARARAAPDPPLAAIAVHVAATSVNTSDNIVNRRTFLLHFRYACCKLRVR